MVYEQCNNRYKEEKILAWEHVLNVVWNKYRPIVPGDPNGQIGDGMRNFVTESFDLVRRRWDKEGRFLCQEESVRCKHFLSLQKHLQVYIGWPEESV